AGDFGSERVRVEADLRIVGSGVGATTLPMLDVGAGAEVELGFGTLPCPRSPLGSVLVTEGALVVEDVAAVDCTFAADLFVIHSGSLRIGRANFRNVRGIAYANATTARAPFIRLEEVHV